MSMPFWTAHRIKLVLPTASAATRREAVVAVLAICMPEGLNLPDSEMLAALERAAQSGGERVVCDPELRTGRWHSYETLYAQHVIDDFEAGTLPIGEGTKLASLLCRLLNCNQTRLSKKLKIGKRFYAHAPAREPTLEAIAAHRVRQRRVSELEEMFLMAEGQTVRGAATTPILSEKMQAEWRERFVAHAHTVNQKLRDAWSWNSNKRTGPSGSDAITKFLNTMVPQPGPQTGGDFALSPMAPLFLVQHTPEGSTSSHAPGAINNMVSTHDGVHSMKLYHPTQQQQQAQQQQAAAMSDFYSHVYHQHLVLPSAFNCPPNGANNTSTPNTWLMDLMDGLGGAGVNSSVSAAAAADAEFHALHADALHGDMGGDDGIDMWSSLGNNLASIAFQNSAALGEGGDARRLLAGDAQQQQQLSGAACTHFDNRPADLTHGGDAQTVMDMDGAHVGGAASGGGGGLSRDDGPAEEEEDTEGGNELFQDFVGSFLQQVPFEAVDVWVPLARQETGGRVVLFHAGYFTNELEEWGEYSTNFSFEKGEGLPGRVFGSNTSEWQEDVHLLGHNMFLRLNGAIKTGIRTTFGVPVVSRRGVTFVIVFYSRKTVHVNPALRAFIERTVRSWKFDANVD
ncbi:hypothetical protein JKP88DRAFT_353661 [Tribonema minus]|uniref:Uncharacterized protein n=1 Tax=Tribonema minus TaxID=303371 RepID=A0A835ZCD8_9STRA|nr:hypothetical protein JKP88DRAFT_353661 [Tribonema minus]